MRVWERVLSMGTCLFVCMYVCVCVCVRLRDLVRVWCICVATLTETTAPGVRSANDSNNDRTSSCHQNDFVGIS